MIEPARRAYDEDTRERLVELFGAPERWAVTTRSLVWAQLDVLVPAFTGTTIVTVPLACSYDLELAAAKYLLLAARRRGPAGAALQRHDLLPRAMTAASRWCCCPGTSRSTSGCRCRCGARRSSTTTPIRLGGAALGDARSPPAHEGETGPGHARCLCRVAARGGRAMPEPLEAARRLAALRGVRALSLHAGGDQERHPDTVRDHLPGGLRSRVPGGVRPRPAGVQRGAGAGRRADRDGPLSGHGR